MSRHKHQWEFVDAAYAQPRSGSFKMAEPVNQEMFLQATYGISTITQRCTDCGWIDISLHTGPIGVGDLDQPA